VLIQKLLPLFIWHCTLVQV